MFDKPWIHGRAVDPQTRALRFLSVSAIESGDTKAEGCPRKWAYEKIYGKKPPSTEKQKRGQENHAQVANYLTTGKREIGPMVAKGMHMLPPPDPRLLVEWDLLIVPGVNYPNPLTSAHSDALLAGAPIKLAGVPLLGAIDLAHSLGLNYGSDSIEAMRDPDGTVEVCDWKFVTNDRYLKTPETLKKTTQMCVYGEWVFTVRPQTPFVRLSHGYFMEKGNPRKVTTLVRREEILPQVEHAGGVARTLGHAAQCTDIEQVDANLAACDKYGGCFHRAYCTAPKRQSLAALVGQTAADNLYGQPSQGVIPVTSLLNRANAAAGIPAPTAAPAPAGSLLAAPSGPTPEQVAAEQLRLAEQERQARYRSIVPPGFEDACATVRSYNRGFPCLKAGAAQAFAAAGGQAVAPDYVYPGAGEINYVQLENAIDMLKLANDMAANYGPPPVAISTLAPNAPVSDPRLAAEGGMPTHTANVPPTALGALQPTEHTATPSPEALAAAAKFGVEESKVTEEAPAEKKTRGPRKAKPVEEPKAETGSGVETTPATDNRIHLYIDVATTIPTQSLNDWAQEQADKLARQFGALDIQCAPEDSPLGYEKWRGALRAFIRDEKASPLAPGSYSIDTRYSAVMTTIAEGLAIRVRLSGGTLTRSVR